MGTVVSRAPVIVYFQTWQRCECDAATRRRSGLKWNRYYFLKKKQDNNQSHYLEWAYIQRYLFSVAVLHIDKKLQAMQDQC